jgi:hypothetical protein
VGQHLAGVVLFNQLPIAQHHDAVSQLGDHGQVMSDIDGGRIEPAGDFLDGGQHLNLGGHVQGRGGLVENDDIGLAAHGHGHHGPLQLSAGHLMGKAITDVFRIGQQQLRISGDGIFFSLGDAHHTVLHGSFGILPDEAMGRIE